ncbi:hypothetical protein [Rubrimonas cliftonensis]|uniref:Uncharacterized protein n=1 Tax=Rubrimonas cliftonensis TaxID=89524 RepID=A0A1H3WXV1_9RHOB|nr:hypothetical protein [Rubrimonas cliftonensis]SDZ91933.1 hypothetical protein SAMN05444370_102180 [Rubrimonas cliftonensis]
MEDKGAPLREIGELLERQFPDFICLRCGHDTFMVIANPRPAQPGQTVPRLARRAGLMFERVAFATGTAFDQPENFAKVVCKRCGLAEDHYLPALAATFMKAGGEDD